MTLLPKETSLKTTIMVAFSIFISFLSHNTHAIVRLSPIKSSTHNNKHHRNNSPQRNIKQTDSDKIKLLDIQHIRTIYSDTLPTIKKLVDAFIINNIKAKPSTGSKQKFLNSYHFQRGMFEQIKIDTFGDDFDQMWMLFFTKEKSSNEILLNETLIPDILPPEHKLRLRFMLSLLKGDIRKAQFIYEIYNDRDDKTTGTASSYSNKEEPFWEIAAYILYQIKPKNKIPVKSLDLDEIALLTMTKGTNNVINWENITLEETSGNNKLYPMKEKQIALALLPHSPMEFKLKTLEKLEETHLLKKEYLSVANSTAIKEINSTDESFEQLSPPIKRAIIYRQIINHSDKDSPEKEHTSNILLELIHKFMTTAMNDNAISTCSVIKDQLGNLTPNENNTWIAHDIIRTYAYLGNIESMQLWLGYLLENSPTEWMSVSVYSVFARNKLMVSKDKTNEWLQSFIKKRKFDSDNFNFNEQSISLITLMTDYLLLGKKDSNLFLDETINNKQNNLQDKILTIVKLFNDGKAENNINKMLSSLVGLKQIGLEDYIAPISLELLANHGV